MLLPAAGMVVAEVVEGGLDLRAFAVEEVAVCGVGAVIVLCLQPIGAGGIGVEDGGVVELFFALFPFFFMGLQLCVEVGVRGI